MKRTIQTILTAVVFMFGFVAPVMALASPTATVSAANTKNCDTRLLGIPPWYRGLTDPEQDCAISTPDSAGGIGPFIWKIVLNGVEMVTVIIAYVAVFFILYGGFQFLTGGANPGQIEKARKTITNAIIGLVIAMAAIGINNLIFTLIK